MIVNKQLHSMSKVPRESGERTKFAVPFGIVQEVSKIVYASAVIARAKSKTMFVFIVSWGIFSNRKEIYGRLSMNSS